MTIFDITTEPEPTTEVASPPEIALLDGWARTCDSLPPDEEPVLILLNMAHRIAEVRWETPTYEETFSAFWYWDDPYNDGQDWERSEVTHWQLLPTV